MRRKGRGGVRKREKKGLGDRAARCVFTNREGGGEKGKGRGEAGVVVSWHARAGMDSGRPDKR